MSHEAAKKEIRPVRSQVVLASHSEPLPQAAWVGTADRDCPVAATPSIWPWRLMVEARLANSDHVGAPAPRASNLMRCVNSSMREISGTVTESELLPFFCECRTPTCYSVVWMSAGAFDAKVATERGWMLLDGHEPSALWHRRDPLPTRPTVRVAVRTGPRKTSQVSVQSSNVPPSKSVVGGALTNESPGSCVGKGVRAE
ncbi:MAG: hypothetical protein QOK11_1903 [Pseudonocardiales bacterium]|nr:hypothetical protein [Pseudonocardiales bacterium]